MNGYNLNQLLTWALESRLMQSYTLLPNDHVRINYGGKDEVYDKAEAERLLRQLIRRINSRE